VLSRVLIGTAHHGEVWYVFPIFLVAFHRPITQAKREGGVGRLAEAALSEAGFGDERSIETHHGVNLIVKLLADGQSVSSIARMATISGSLLASIAAAPPT